MVKFLRPRSAAMRGVTRSGPHPPSPGGAGPGRPEPRRAPPPLPSLGPSPLPAQRSAHSWVPRPESVRARLTTPRHATQRRTAPHRTGEAGLRGSAPGPARLYRAAAPIPPRHVRPAAPAPPAGVPAGPPTPGVRGLAVRVGARKLAPFTVLRQRGRGAAPDTRVPATLCPRRRGILKDIMQELWASHLLGAATG